MARSDFIHHILEFSGTLTPEDSNIQPTENAQLRSSLDSELVCSNQFPQHLQCVLFKAVVPVNLEGTDLRGCKPSPISR